MQTITITYLTSLTIHLLQNNMITDATYIHIRAVNK